MPEPGRVKVSPVPEITSFTIEFSCRKKTRFREKYILRVHYYFFKKITSNNVKFYNNKLFLINNNAHCG